MLRTGLVLFFLCVTTVFSFGQNTQLGLHYFDEGEYEKAIVIFEEYLQKTPQDEFFVDKYISALLQINDTDKAEKYLRSRIKKNPKSTDYVLLSDVMQEVGDLEQSNNYLTKAVDFLENDRSQINLLGEIFMKRGNLDMAIKVFEKGIIATGGPEVYGYTLSRLYVRANKIPKFIKIGIDLAKAQPNRLQTIKTYFDINLKEEEHYEELENQLYDRIQEEGDSEVYSELLAFVAIKRGDIKTAFRQLKALDKRKKGNGRRLISLARIANQEGQYEEEVKIYEYLLTERGDEFTDGQANFLLLKSKRQLLERDSADVSTAFENLAHEYQTQLDKMPLGMYKIQILMELADLQQFVLFDDEAAKKTLKTVVEDLPPAFKQLQAQAKLKLGDIYLSQGDKWEASLLYSQVDKALREEYWGEQARFKGAKLSYYFGDFDWAKEKFDILKAATTKLISNDAIDMSVFIVDNMGLDTTDIHLKAFAKAELLIFQKKYNQAIEAFDDLALALPADHNLQDDILYMTAQIQHNQEKYDEALAIYQRVVDNYYDQIRADNALYNIARIYEEKLDNKDKAMAYYEKIFVDFKSSTFAVEARKRFRELRGDAVK